MATRIGINGFGRIGRNFFRALPRAGRRLRDRRGRTTSATRRRWRTCSSTTPCSGRSGEDVEVGDGTITAGGHELQVLAERDPAALPWGDLGVDVVIESTGLFTEARGRRRSTSTPARRRSIISAPATDPDVTLVLGVNDGDYDPERHNIISNASCTTNCVAPIAKVLHDAFTIEQGFMTTIHAYTNDQQILDLPHKDLRRARAAAINLIPTSTGAARAIGARHARAQGQGRRHLGARARPDRARSSTSSCGSGRR